MRGPWNMVVVLALAGAPLASSGEPPAAREQGKLSYVLHRVAAAAEAGRPLPLRGRAFVHGASGTVSAVLELAPGATVDDVRGSVAAAGGEIKAASRGRVKVKVPARNLRALSRDAHVRRVREPFDATDQRKMA